MKRLVAFLFLSLLISQAFASKRDSVLLTGSVYSNEDKVTHVIIKIYDGNNLLKSVEVGRSNRFRTYLPVNKYLTIQIEAPGFHDKRFSFDSHIPDGTMPIPSYDFDMDIFKEEEVQGVNTSILDFPVGLVYYDEKKGEFVHNKSYTKKMKKEYYNLLEKAKMAERSLLKESEK